MLSLVVRNFTCGRNLLLGSWWGLYMSVYRWGSTLWQVIAGVLCCCIYIVRLWQADFGSKVVMAGVNMSFLLRWSL